MNPNGMELTTAVGASDPPFNWQGRLSLLAILIVGAVAYHNSFTGCFLLDDHHWITDNPGLRQFPPTWRAILINPRPTLQASLFISYGMGKTSVWAYHAFNLAVHLLAGLLLYGVVRRTLRLPKLRARYGERASALALIIALLWLVHPLHTQSVTYVIQRCESMMGLFVLLALYCVIRSIGSRYRVWWGIGAFLSCVLGMAAKEVAVVAPLIILLYDRIFVAHSLRHLVRCRWGMHLALTSIWLIPSIIWFGLVPVNAGFGYQGITPLHYAMTQAGVILYYLRLSVWPSPLCLDYSDWPQTTTLAEFAWPGLAVAGLLLATGWALLRRPMLGFLGVWFFLILAPSSSIMPIADLAFEQRMYLSLAAVIVVGVLAGDVALRWLFTRLATPGLTRQLLTGGLITMLVTMLTLLTIRRNMDYASEITMWTDVVAKRPNNVRGHCTLGTAYWRQKDLSMAALHHSAALALEPRSLFARNGIGLCLMEQQRYEEALTQFTAVAETNVDVVFGHNNRGLVLYWLNRPAEAAESFREAARIAPRAPNYWLNLAIALTASGATDEAREAYGKAIGLSPEWPNAARKQAWRIATTETVSPADIKHGLLVARQAAEVSQEQDPEIVDTLAAAYAQAGQFDEAMSAAEKALALAEEEGKTALVREIRARLSLYEEGLPFRDAQP